MATKTRTCRLCDGEGYILNDGDTRDCPACCGDGYEFAGYVFTADSWLHIPSQARWINPNQVAQIYGTLTFGVSQITGYAIHFDDINTDVLTVDDPDDVAAVTAWLEARS